PFLRIGGQRPLAVADWQRDRFGARGERGCGQSRTDADQSVLEELAAKRAASFWAASIIGHTDLSAYLGESAAEQRGNFDSGNTMRALAAPVRLYRCSRQPDHVF